MGLYMLLNNKIRRRIVFNYYEFNFFFQVFTNDDCSWVSHEVTSTLKVDKFIDILLTKGPKAIGHFHSALETEYPAMFEVLSRLFVTSGVNLPPERQLKGMSWSKLHAHCMYSLVLWAHSHSQQNGELSSE